MVISILIILIVTIFTLLIIIGMMDNDGGSYTDIEFESTTVNQRNIDNRSYFDVVLDVNQIIPEGSKFIWDEISVVLGVRLGN